MVRHLMFDLFKLKSGMAWKYGAHDLKKGHFEEAVPVLGTSGKLADLDVKWRSHYLYERIRNA
jgi:hypothetical protein